MGQTLIDEVTIISGGMKFPTPCFVANSHKLRCTWNSALFEGDAINSPIAIKVNSRVKDLVQIMTRTCN